MKKQNDMEIYKKGDIFECQFTYSGDNWEQWILLASDIHFDSRVCDRSLLSRHFQQAKDKDAPIFVFGDFFDVMGTKKDPRSHMSDIRPEYTTKKGYLNLVSNDAIDFCKKYPIEFISEGNHEQNIAKRHEIDIIENLCKGIDAKQGDYAGYLRFSFYNQTGGGKRKLDMYYNHGAGGNSPVTKGTIQTNRRGVAFDADIFVSGHNHNRWSMELMRQRVDKMGNIKTTAQNHINLGTYKGQDDWEKQMGFPSPNKGGVWLRFYKFGDDEQIRTQVINA
jgi:hypothetical protein